MADRYPDGTVRALLDTDHVSDATRAVLTARLAEPAVVDPAFFHSDEFATLRAVCERLIPQPDRSAPIDLAGGIDRRLASGQGDGWRYDALPPDGQMYRLLLGGIEAISRARRGVRFVALDGAGQDEILAIVQRGAEDPNIWGDVPAATCFEELLAEAAETYYAHPFAQEEIGYAGMADLPGWNRIGLNEREEREPRPVAPS